MLFNSLFFLVVFLPFVFLGFRFAAAIGHQCAVAWLVAVSLLFYGWWNPAYLILLCGSILFNYSVGMLLIRTAEKNRLQGLILALGVTANLLLLGYYKYLFPFLHSLERFGVHLVPAGSSVLLPLGISFFTFTQIGYLVDCKAGLAAGRRFLNYAFFVTFFPHLIAGPILHHREILPQIEKEDAWRFNSQNIAIGLSIFFIGLAKKDVLADQFAIYAKFAFDHAGALTWSQAWCGALSYSMQLYFDFSGYSEMAIGLALLFNIHFPANFDSPYQSASIIDFWQRWHMTLTRYLNLYLYNPIALWVTRFRAKKKLPVGRQGMKTFEGFLSIIAFPTFVTMTLIGIWHGAGFQFVVFGLLHGCYLVINHLWRLLMHKKNAPELAGPTLWLNTGWKIGLTYLCVLVGQVVFRANSFHDSQAMLANMVGYHLHDLPETIKAPVISFHGLLLILAFPFVLFAPNVLQIFAPWQPTLTKPHSPGPKWYEALQWKPTLPWGLAIGGVALLGILAATGQTEFLYFRF